MMKRWLAALIAAALCFTVLPVGVLAEDSATEPQLFVQYLFYNTEDLLIEDTGATLQNSRDLSMNSMFHAFFYYGTSEADFVMVPAASLRAKNTCITVEEIAANELADQELAGYAVAVRPNAFGSSGVIYIDADSVEHEFPMTVTLPWLGFYSANERTEANYLGNDLSFIGSTTDANGDAYETVYILAEDDWTFTGLALDPNGEGYDMNFLTYTIASDGSYVELTLKEGFASDNYCVKVYLTHSNGSTGESNLWFEIHDNRPGLRFKHVVNDENDNYFVLDGLISSLHHEINRGDLVAAYYVNGTEETPIPLSDLNIPSFINARLLDDSNPYFIQLSFESFGSGEITCDSYPGISIPVTVSLPVVGFYHSAIRSESTYADEELVFTGSSAEGTSQYYLLWEDGWTITGIDTDPDNEGQNMSFFSWKTVTDDNGNDVVLVSIKDGFEEDNWYNIMVTAKNGNGNTRDRWCGFSIADNRPGLRFRHVDNDENDNYFVEDELNSELNGRIENNYWIAVYYVDGANETLIPMSDLNIPAVAKAEQLTDDSPYYFRLRLTNLGSGEITCDTYPGCSLPVTVDLPRAAFYSSTVRSGDTYLSETLPFTGKTTDASGEPYETVYILPEDGRFITGVTLDPDQEGYDMNFFDYVIAADGSYVEVTLTDGFAGYEYCVEVSMQRTTSNSTSRQYLSFTIADTRPGLRFKHVDRDENDNYFVEDELYSSLDRSIDGGTRIAVYYVDGANETLIPMSDLNLPSIVDAWLLDDNNAYFMQCNFISFGTGEITCDTYPGCSIPVSVSLPSLGFYDSAIRSESTYAGEELVYTGASDGSSQYYLLWQDGWTITGIDTDPDNNGQDMSFFTWKTVTDDNGNDVVLVSIKDGFEEDNWYDIKVTAQNDNGNSWNYWLGFRVMDTSPGLKYRYVDWDGSRYILDLSEPLHSSIDRSPGIAMNVAFFYVENGNEILLDYNALTFPKTILTTRLSWDQSDAFTRIECETFGLGNISYTHTDGKIYTLPVTITLPDVGWYSEPDAAIDTYLYEMLMGKYGETKTAYFVWDPDEYEALEKITVYFKQSNEEEPALDDVKLEDAKDVLASYNITLTPSPENGYVKADARIDIDKNLELTLHFKNGRRESAWLNIDNEINAKIREWRINKENPSFTYQGNEYTFGIGRVHDNGKFDMFDAGMGFGWTTNVTEAVFDETVYLGAMMNWGEKNEQTAPAWVHNAISDVSFEIVDYVNFHDLDDQASSNAYVDKTYTTTYNGYTMATADIKTQPGGFVEALLEVTFTVTMPGEAPVECKVHNVVHFAYGFELAPDMSDIDTAAELNQILSSKDAFLTWVQEQDKKTGMDLYDQYMAWNAYNWDVRFALNLPAVTYNDIIKVDLTDMEFCIYGTTDETTGKRTTLPGMWVHKNDGFFTHGIDFVAVDGITQKYNGETFTCGILSLGDSLNNHYGDSFSVSGCNFTGFDYGVRNTPYGYTNVEGGNVFSNCGIGYLIDCAGKTSGNANDTTQHNIFENCDIGIKIVGLPEYISSYDYRIYECDFISNNHDIVSEMSETLYCYHNFFGHFTQGAKSLKDVTSMDQIQSRPAGILETYSNTVLTNPRYAYSVVAWNPGDSNYLTLDGGRNTYILNSQAADLLMDADALNTMINSSQEPVIINVMDSDEKILGTWTF